MAVNIAMIDSGVNPWHSHVMGIDGGLALSLGPEGGILESPDFRDELGHGTAIAGIIRGKARFASLYAVKIFHKDLSAPAALLFGALDWAIRNDFKIIHLSLGTERRDDRIPLKNICREAYDRNVIIVASGRRPDDQVFPAALETVVGVCWDRQCDEAGLSYYAGCKIEFGAYGWPRVLPGQSQNSNFRGSSFATAQVTARIAQLLEKNPDAGTRWVKKTLKEGAERRIYRYE